MPVYGGIPIQEDGSILISLVPSLPLQKSKAFWDTAADWAKGTLGSNLEIFGTGSVAVLRPNSTTVQGPNIYLNWKFNETTGTTAADSSQYNRPGTLVTFEGYNPSQWVAGKLNNALSNPGEYESNDYVEGGDIAGFEWDTPFSVECWFNQSPGYDSVLAGNFNLTEVKGWHLGVQEGYLRMALVGGSENVIQTYSTTQVTPSTYQHLVVTYDGTGLAAGIKFYLDGLLLTNSAYSDTLAETSIVPATNNFHAMAIPEIGGWIGQIDEFNLYTKVLSQTEVDTRYNAGSGTEVPLETAEWYKTTAHYETNVFDSGTNSQLYDALGLDYVLPGGTTVVVKARTSNDLDNMGSYGSNLTIGSPLSLTGQFIQFSIDFTGTIAARAVIDSLSLYYTAPAIIPIVP